MPRNALSVKVTRSSSTAAVARHQQDQRGLFNFRLHLWPVGAHFIDLWLTEKHEKSLTVMTVPYSQTAVKVKNRRHKNKNRSGALLGSNTECLGHESYALPVELGGPFDIWTKNQQGLAGWLLGP
jgi:hypothetical protein